MLANYGVDRGLGDENVASSYDDDIPYTPAWQESITGVRRDLVIATAREFAETAEKTHGKSMVILGAGINHWYNMDMTYRGIINMLVFCGCVGQSGGGWAHYVGQEKVRPQVGWATIAFATDWYRPPRHMNGTSYFYEHTDQWRYEKVTARELLSPTAPPGDWDGKPRRFQRALRAHGMAAVSAAPGQEPHSDRKGRRRRWGGTDPFRDQTPQKRRDPFRLRGPGQSRKLPAEHVRLAVQYHRVKRQGARVLPAPFPRHTEQRPGSGPRRARGKKAA